MAFAAGLNLFAFVLMSTANTDLNTLMLFGACEIIMILSAVGCWKKYFEEYIKYMNHK
jgi:hypothetical protein